MGGVTDWGLALGPWLSLEGGTFIAEDGVEPLHLDRIEYLPL